MLVTLSQALKLLHQGQLVAIPTETVYGLAADASQDQALSLLYATKGRPSDHPVILHVADQAMCRPFVRDVPEPAVALMEAYWPGPLTLLLERSDLVSSRITGGRPLVGVRVPATPLALKLLREFGRPLVAPSANRFGHISPTSAAHVEEEFAGQVAVLDGGPCQVGLESAIVKVEKDRLLVLRPGQLDLKNLAEISGLAVVRLEHQVDGGVPGALKSHYAPLQPMWLLTPEQLADADGKDCAVLSITEGAWPEASWVRRLPAQANDYARELYQALRDAEAADCQRILVEIPPTTPEWSAVHDRLRRASTR